MANPSSGGIGGFEGGGLLERIGRRAIFRTMQAAIDKGLHVGDVGLAKAIATAEIILDDDTATHRDKLRASEFLSSVVSKGIEVAMHADKREPPEPPPPSKVTAREYVIEFDRGG